MNVVTLACVGARSMQMRVLSSFVLAIFVAAPTKSLPQDAPSRVEAALTNVMTLHRPGQDGLATFWDGNKYVQCRWMPERNFRCEAAGTLMQPSLGRVLTPERLTRLSALGWQLDPSFGNYVQTFPGGAPASRTAQQILQVLGESYQADVANLEIRTDWIKSAPCPPRNGPSQNLAGIINDSPSMARTAVRGCTYKPASSREGFAPVNSRADLITVYGGRVTGEIQRLRINLDRRVFVAVDTGGGYVQCAPDSSARAIYCEAQSAESWPVLARILTPDRVARLHAAGFADPGRAPNYWKLYPLGQFDDGGIADELLTILYEVYSYNGAPALEFKTEKSP